MVTLAVIALAGVSLQPVTVLTMTTDDGATLVCRRMAPASTVTLVFTHSMYGGEVRETWRADGAALGRVRIETDNAAAAEYYAYDGRVERTDTGFEVVVPPFRTDELPVRVDQVGRHRLRFGADEVSLAEQVNDSVAAMMSVSQVALMEWLFDDACR